MADLPIRFEYQGKEYQVSYQLFDEKEKRILLPDMTLLDFREWLLSYPPVPHGLCRVEHRLHHLSLTQAARELDASIAEESL